MSRQQNAYLGNQATIPKGNDINTYTLPRLSGGNERVNPENESSLSKQTIFEQGAIVNNEITPRDSFRSNGKGQSNTNAPVKADNLPPRR
jgi:hypothetical protein